MNEELRCTSGRLHGIIEKADGSAFLEVSCRSKACGKLPGVIVLHRFDMRSGECVSTRRYKEPRNTTQERSEQWCSDEQSPSVSVTSN